MKWICYQCKREARRHRNLPKRKDLITKKQWSMIKRGTVFKNPAGVLRKHLGSKSGHSAVFWKMNPSMYKGNTTVYTYNDLRHTYRIVKL